MAFAPKTKEFKSEAGNEYLFQTVLPSVWARTIDRITDKNGKLLNEHAMQAMLDHVVVQPQGLKMDDFESWGELEEVTQAAFMFQQRGK